MTSVANCTVLMAEDDENDVFFLQRAFKQAKLPNPIQHVKDGEDAIAYLAGTGPYADRAKFPLPGFILLDLKMPRRNGFEVITWVRGQPGIKRLPIAILTSSREELDVNRAYEIGANTYLVKPVKFDDLLETIKTLGHFWFVLAKTPTVTV